MRSSSEACKQALRHPGLGADIGLVASPTDVEQPHDPAWTWRCDVATDPVLD